MTTPDTAASKSCPGATHDFVVYRTVNEQWGTRLTDGVLVEDETPAEAACTESTVECRHCGLAPAVAIGDDGHWHADPWDAAEEAELLAAGFTVADPTTQATA